MPSSALRRRTNRAGRRRAPRPGVSASGARPFAARRGSTLTYNSAGQLVKLADELQNVTSYAYDRVGHLNQAGASFPTVLVPDAISGRCQVPRLGAGMALHAGSGRRHMQGKKRKRFAVAVSLSSALRCAVGISHLAQFLSACRRPVEVSCR